jgi:hypothetical protein
MSISDKAPELSVMYAIVCSEFNSIECGYELLNDARVTEEYADTASKKKRRKLKIKM